MAFRKQLKGIVQSQSTLSCVVQGCGVLLGRNKDGKNWYSTN